MTNLASNSRFFRAFPALEHAPFRWFWRGQIISVIGTWTQNIGQAWLVLQLTNSPFLLGLVSAMQFLPMLLLSLHAGAWIDRISKRRIIILTQTTLMILAFTLALLVGTGLFPNREKFGPKSKKGCLISVRRRRFCFVFLYWVL